MDWRPAGRFVEYGLRIERRSRSLAAWLRHLLGAASAMGVPRGDRLHLRRVQDLAELALPPFVELFGIDGGQEQSGLAIIVTVVRGDNGVEGVVAAQTFLRELLVVDTASTARACSAPGSCRLPPPCAAHWPSDPLSLQTCLVEQFQTLGHRQGGADVPGRWFLSMLGVGALLASVVLPVVRNWLIISCVSLDGLHVLPEGGGELPGLGQILVGFLTAQGRRLRAVAKRLIGVRHQTVDALPSQESDLLIELVRIVLIGTEGHAEPLRFLDLVACLQETILSLQRPSLDHKLPRPRLDRQTVGWRFQAGAGLGEGLETSIPGGKEADPESVALATVLDGGVTVG